MRGAEIIGENDKPTVAGLVLFGIDTSHLLPQSGLQFAHFEGNEIGEQLIDKKEFKGALTEILENTLSSIRANLPVSSVIEGTKNSRSCCLLR
tara:strand:- start:19412 stop:19690 length:279 start_codon:yes stop_codon:yes gene_type:complete